MSTRRVSPEGRGGKGMVHKQPSNSLVALPLDPRTRYERFIDGDLPVSELTMDELTKGKIMDKDGSFRGRPREKIPAAFFRQITRELQSRMNGMFRELAVDAVDTIAEVMYKGEGEQTSQNSRAGTQRLKAATYVVERIIGKVPDKLEISQDVTVWQGLQEGDGLLVDIGDDNEIVAEVVEDVREEAPPAPRRRSPRTAQRRPPVA